LRDRPRAAIVVTGSELVRGERRDANGPFLAGELVRRGIDPLGIVVVSDRVEDLEPAIAAALAADVCVTSGGLGPTHDDRTVELVAQALGRPLHVDPGLEAEIREVSRGLAERLGRPFADFVPGVRKQATIPEGAQVLGRAGTAPGLLLEHSGGKVVIVLPGPPAELQRLWLRAVEHPAFRSISERAVPRRQRLLRFFGPSESTVARVLDDLGGEGGGVEITICARDFEIHVDLLVDEGAESRGDELERELRARFGPQLFADDPRTIAEIVLDLCRERGFTLATAESCTGGLVGARLTDVPGSSEVYLGGVICYSNEAKESQLGVPRETLERHGAVSAETAEAMAAGARTALGADVAVAVTGVAGPGGGTPEKPVGLVFVHAESPGGKEALRLELPGDRGRVRGRATAHALHGVRRLLLAGA
jgi:nicotinamide-nucleotide amidase